jgi:GTP-binding protein
VERASVLVHLVDVASAETEGALEAWRTVRRELSLYEPALTERPEVVVLSKIDALGGEGERLSHVRAAFERERITPVAISAVTGEGIGALVRCMADRVAETRAAEAARQKAPEEAWS